MAKEKCLKRPTMNFLSRRTCTTCMRTVKTAHVGKAIEIQGKKQHGHRTG